MCKCCNCDKLGQFGTIHSRLWVNFVEIHNKVYRVVIPPYLTFCNSVYHFHYFQMASLSYVVPMSCLPSRHKLCPTNWQIIDAPPQILARWANQNSFQYFSHLPFSVRMFIWNIKMGQFHLFVFLYGYFEQRTAFVVGTNRDGFDENPNLGHHNKGSTKV